jgi:hypothetical protein
MDISASITPRSDQQNYDDYITGPKTVTVSEVRQGSAEQPVEIHLVEFPGRPYKPSKSMRRVLVAAWGSEASQYTGRRLTLTGDPTVKFGGQVVGGIKIAALSHIDKPLNVSLTVTRGKRAPHTVQPLPDAPTVDPAKIEAAHKAITNATDHAALDKIEHHATSIGIQAHITDAIKQRREELG